MEEAMSRIVKTLLLCAAFLVSISSYAVAQEKSGHEHAVHWGYEGEAGPVHWGDLESEYAACKLGKNQSPIDIQQAKVAPGAAVRAIEFDYKSAPLNILNNGHTIVLNYTPGSSVKIDGKKYELLQFHFHAPSEHTVAAKPFVMEAHLVHKDAEGKLAVIGVFMVEGKENAFIAEILKYMPEKAAEKKTDEHVMINALKLLPDGFDHYFYTGSLTTPPCSEGVSWNVLKTPIEVSKAQVERYVSVMGKNTARPAQELGDRKVTYSSPTVK
jgi:carbonic anhydrase